LAEFEIIPAAQAVAESYHKIIEKLGEQNNRQENEKHEI